MRLNMMPEFEWSLPLLKQRKININTRNDSNYLVLYGISNYFREKWCLRSYEYLGTVDVLGRLGQSQAEADISELFLDNREATDSTTFIEQPLLP